MTKTTCLFKPWLELFYFYSSFIPYFRIMTTQTNTMTPEQFVEAYLRTPQDYDKKFWFQCVDLARLYCEKVHWIKIWAFWGTALQGWANKNNTFDPKYWTKVVNTPSAIPPQGAIIFYKNPPKTGHVGVVWTADLLDVLLLEENWGTGNGDWKGYNVISFNVKLDYTWCLGWYVKKK